MSRNLGASDLPVTVQAVIVMVSVTALDLAIAAYLESAAAAAVGWPLLFLTAATVLVATLDVVRRVSSRLVRSDPG